MALTNPIYLYGASGHTKVICEILESQNLLHFKLIDDNCSIKSLLEFPVYHSLKDAGFAAKDRLIISIGNNRVRKTLAEKINGAEYHTAIHTSAVISRHCTIGEGTVVMPNVSINADCEIGKHCILNTNCSVDHDCVVGNYVHIAPNVALAGNIQIREGTFIGVGASVIPNLKIGKWVTIGAGAVIIEDIPDFAVVVGNPGKVIKYNNPPL